LVYPSVDPEFLATAPAPRSPADKVPTVGYAGNFHPWQGLELLLDAMRMIWEQRDVELRLWGVDTAEATKRFGRLDSRIVCMGRLPLDQMPTALRSVDALVIPRPDLPPNSTTSRKLGEYLASGTGLVVTDVADHRRLVGESGAGEVTPPTAAGVASGVLRVLADPARTTQQARVAIEIARRWFSIEQATDLRAAVLATAAGPLDTSSPPVVSWRRTQATLR